jgi:hypothetical protein
MFKYLEMRQRAQMEQDNRVRVYNDVAVILWYVVAHDSVLSYKSAKMDEQREPFRVYQWGNKCMIFGPIKALTSETDKEKFVKQAEAELRDRGFERLRVGVYRDAVIVRQ